MRSMRGNTLTGGIATNCRQHIEENSPRHRQAIKENSPRAPSNQKDFRSKNDKNPWAKELGNPSEHIPSKAYTTSKQNGYIPSAASIASDQNGDSLKLIFCAIGIYSAYLVHGSLQEDIFTYRSTVVSSPSFKSVWFIQVVEAFTNTTLAFFCHRISSRGKETNTEKKYRVHFFSSGASQVFSKAFTSLSLTNGLSFPVAIMAKSAKMAPVMMGQLLLGGSTYCSREYCQVVAIIVGTSMMGLSKNSNRSYKDPFSTVGLYFIILSLIMDGMTAGIQKRIKHESRTNEQTVTGYEFMMRTNLSMGVIAISVAMVNGDLANGFNYCRDDPVICNLIIKFLACSAIGQLFIFYTIAHFDPLVCSTITTSRKLVSVFLSILLKGHILNRQGYFGICLAFSGILSELRYKYYRRFKKTKVGNAAEMLVQNFHPDGSMCKSGILNILRSKYYHRYYYEKIKLGDNLENPNQDFQSDDSNVIV